MTNDSQASPPTTIDEYEDGLDSLDVALVMVRHWLALLLVPIFCGLLALGGAFLMKPVFTARAVILAPQAPQSASALALQSLGALSGVVGGVAGIKSPADQYVALMQSRTAEGRLIDEFKLLDVYELKLRTDAHKRLRSRTSIALGKKDGLISIEVEDHDPQRAAALANAYVEQLTRITSELAVTEAQQRRKFFELELQQASEKLSIAQKALQATGVTQGVLRADPRAAVENYARLKAEITATEMRLKSASMSLADSAPEMLRLRSELQSLQQLAAKAERTDAAAAGGEYVARFRDFKYQETLFELFARQYEAARVDESREGAIVQVVDAATPPERKSKPMRGVIAVVTTVVSGLLLLAFLVSRERLQTAEPESPTARKYQALRVAMGRTRP